MHQRLLPRRPRDLTRTGLISGRLLVALALLLGTMTVGLSTASAQSAGSFEYDEGTVTWSVEYDDGVWTEGTSTAADFSLETEAGSLAQFLTIPDVGVDPAACLENVIPEFEGPSGADASDAVIYEDESGDPVTGDTDAYAYEVRTITLDGADAETVHTCWAIDGESVLWAVTLVPGGDEAELEAAFALVDGVAIDGEPTPIGLPAGDGVTTSGTDDDATPEADDDATPEADDDATAEASDDATPVADDGTPVAGGSGADEDAGTYTSPTYGYTLEFPAGDWIVDSDSAAAGGRDVLSLTTEDESSTLFIEGSEEWADTDECVEVLLEEIGVDPAVTDTVEDPETGDPYEVSEDGRSAVAYTASQGNEGATALIDCRQDEGSDVIVGFTHVSSEFEAYFDVAYPAVEEILDSLEF